MDETLTAGPPSGTDDLTDALRARLPGFGHLNWLDSTGSTNTDLMTLARASAAAPLPWLQGAWQQHSGRGRAGKPWQTQRGDALLFSCAFEAHMPMGQLPALSPACGVAICEALRALAGTAGAQLGMKWPNDIQLGPAKLVGVLVETVKQATSGAQVVVIGIGINLRNAPALSLALGRAVADWSQLQPRYQSADLVQAVTLACQQAVATCAEFGYAPFVARHARVDVLRDAPVRVIDNGKVVLEGIAAGTDTQGRLLVANAAGLQPVFVGEISVRPV